MEQETTTGRAREPQHPRRRRRPITFQVRTGALVAVAVVIGLVIWLLVRGGGGGGVSKPKVQHSTVVAVSEQGLKTFAGVLHSPIYWAGPQLGVRYELTQTPSGRVFVRYLPAGASVGTSKQYLFVSTSPLQDAFSKTRKVAERSDSVRIPIGHGGVAFYGSSTPTNVYVAFPGSDYQIQVFDPNPGRPSELVALGRIQPVAAVAGAPAAGPTVAAASPGALGGVAATLGHPVYWAGPKPGVTYELTLTPSGNVFVRYLPAGAPVRTSKQYLFVGTLPLPNAFQQTRDVARRPTSVRVPVGAGGIAFYSRSLPTNVYLAFPGSSYQIEVFDPNPRQARKVVSSGQVRPVS